MGRVAVVTGGTTGIGAATSLALKAEGYTVCANYLGNESAATAFGQSSGLPVFEWDVASFDSCAKGIADIQAKHGPVDVLVNNAGITRDSMLHKMTLEQWRSVIDIDLGGCFNMCRAVIEGMRERKFGRIINISSINALSGQAGQTNYAAAKAGMIGFTKALALETASRGITVNAIAPGYTNTAMVAAVRADILQTIIDSVPVKRLGTPEEIARGVVFLASDAAGFITGATLSINGGKYMA
ncbi:MAG: acetoacetyl-CoA reductase [Bradyrhizobiaceae bacterium]|nr:MAG: acetoacetyl-CoA reductase [Bradyrhizobiaceae bacterium]